MANKIQSIDLDKTPKNVLQSILDACERIDANELGLKDFYRGTAVTWSIPELGINYQNTTADEFNQIIKNSTNEDSISRAYAEIYEKVQKLEKGTPEMKGAEKSPVEANRPTKESLETMQEEVVAKETHRKERIEQSNRDVRAAIEQKQKIQDEINNQNNKTQQKPAEKVAIDQKETSTITPQPEYTETTTTTPLSKSLSATAVTPEANRMFVEETQPAVKSFVSTTTYLSDIKKVDPEIEKKISELKSASQEESLQEKIHVQERLSQMRAAMSEKKKAYVEEIAKAKQIQKDLQGEPIKVYVKVPESIIETNPEAQALKQMAIANPQQFVKDTSAQYQSRSVLKDLPANEAKIVADDAALTTYETLTGGSPIIQTATVHAIINNSVIIGKVSSDPRIQAEIRKHALGIASSTTSQRELYKQFIESQKIEGIDSDNVIVQISENPQPGYQLVDGRQLINQSVTTPYISSLENQSDALDYVGKEISEAGIGGVKSRLLDKAGIALSNKIASLPQDGALAKAYNSKLVQYGLSRVGLVTPAAWTAAESSWMGNLLVSGGYGELGGFIQGVTGLNLGLVPATPIFNEFGSVALSIIGPETAAIPAVETIAKTAGQAGKQSLNIALGNSVARGASAIAARFGFTAASAKIGAAVGTGIMPVVGTIVGVALGTVFGKLIERFGPQIKKFFNQYGKYFLGAGLVAGLIGAPLIAAPLLLIGGASVLASGIGFAGAGLGILSFFRSVGGAILFAITTPIIITIIALPLLVALVLFIINSGAYVVPPRVPDSPFVGGGGFPIECTDEKGPVGIDGPFSLSPIGNRAWEITYDLYQGFWCYWNRSPIAPPQYFPNDTLEYPPGYPNLFDYSTFLANPNPPPGFQGNLFWCTWLVVKSYNETGNSTPASLYTPSMYNDFLARGKILDSSEATVGNIAPGSVVFFHVTTGANRLNHVGVVYAVDRGGIDMVQSNAPTKYFRLPFNQGGTGVPGVGSMQVKYFGLP